MRDYCCIVLVFDQLHDPQFLHRLVRPDERRWMERLITTKGVEQTALVIREYSNEYKTRVYISDLVNHFKEINGCNILDRYMTGDNYTCIIDVHGEMYRNEGNHVGGDSYYLDISFDGEQFLFNESKFENFDLADFTREEIASCCLPYQI